MSELTEEHIDAKIRRILKSETLLSDLTFRFACESFPDVTDVMVYGEDGSVYDVEPNTYAEGSSIERGLFHMYLIGSKMLGKGERWSDLRKGVVIMLNRYDIFKEGKAVRHFSILDVESGEKASLCSMELYVVFVSPNGRRGVERDDLLRDLFVGYYQEEMSLPMTKKVVDYILEEGVQESMYEYMKEYFAQELAEGRASGRAEGAKEATISNARAMLAGGIPSDRVADILKLSESDMKEVMNMR